MNTTTTFSDDFSDGCDTVVIGNGWSYLNAEQRATLWVCEGLAVDVVDWFYSTINCAE